MAMTERGTEHDHVKLTHETVLTQWPRLESWLADHAARILREAAPPSES